MLPPPAPTSARSTTGTLTACPPPFTRRLDRDMPAPISCSVVQLRLPPSMSDALAVVPPMSKLITLSKPDALTDPLRGHDPRSGAGLDDADGRFGGPVEGHDAAVGLHDAQGGGDPGRAGLA